MAFSSGTFSLVAGNPVVTGTTISSTWANDTLSDIATNGLSICLLKDGTQTPTANIPLGGFKLTGLGNGTAVADAPRVSQVQNSSFTSLTSVSGASTITAAATPTPAAYAEGQVFSFLAIGANAAAPTLNVSSLGAVPIFWGGATCTSSMWSTGTRLDVTYISTSSQTGFHILGHSGFMPQNLLRVRGSIISGSGTGGVQISAPSADGQYIASTASASAGLAWKTFSATQAQQETASAIDVAATPGVQQFHPSAAKAWYFVTVSTGTPTLAAGYNVASITDTGVGILTVTFTTAFSSTAYPFCVAAQPSTDFNAYDAAQAHATDSLEHRHFESNAVATDPTNYDGIAFGDQ